MAAESSSPPSFTPRRKWTVGFDVVVRTVVVLAVVVMTNYLAGKLFHREYLSAHTQTELASRTVSLVESLTNEVKVTVYYDREDELFSTVTALLREYGALNPRIRIEIVDYLRDAAAAQRVKLAYKLPEATKNEEKAGGRSSMAMRWPTMISGSTKRKNRTSNRRRCFAPRPCSMVVCWRFPVPNRSRRTFYRATASTASGAVTRSLAISTSNRSSNKTTSRSKHST
jgi:hypothetical protein